MIGNVSSNISILIIEGQNDSQTPLQQALLLQQRLTEANHPDHQIIVYPNLDINLSLPINGYPQMVKYQNMYFRIFLNGYPLHRDRNSLLYCLP